VIINRSHNYNLYVNGENKGSGSLARSLITNNDNLYISGSAAGIGWAFFYGLIDEAAIFNYAVSDADIKAMYNNGNGHILNGAQTCNLSADLVTANGYLSSIPIDPTKGNTYNSGYLIKRDPSGTISVKAPYASQYATANILVSQ